MQASVPFGDTPDNSWPAYRHMVLSSLERLDERDKRLDDKLEKIIRLQEFLRSDIAGLQARSGIFGLVGGLIPVVITLFYLLVGGWGR